MLSFVECILISIQICLWLCRCPKELPEVPSCRRRNFWADVTDGSDSDGSSDGEGSAAESNSASRGASGESNESQSAFGKACRKRSAVSRWRVAPKNFDNCFGEKEGAIIVLTRRELNAMMSAQLELYGPKQEFE
ncbi:hypothetical protein AAVH_20678 [Aphelenchoides avenae]|nr:hypothetical protein AAVH_20678 [Aphelenchus avenae]